MGTVFKIAGGIFFGFLMLWFFSAAVFSVVVNESAKTAQQAMQQSADRVRRAAQISEDRRRRDLAKAAVRQVQQRERVEAVAAAERRKALAWDAFWKPTVECVTATSIECGNQHIRAKREFERRYAAGEL